MIYKMIFTKYNFHCKKLLIPAFLLFSGVSFAEELTTEVSLLSNYLYRGESLSSNKPALQATVDYEHSSGIELGTFISSGDSKMPLEIDLYTSYDMPINDHTEFQIKLTAYLYPYKKSDNSLDTELGIQWYASTVQYSYDFILDQHYTDLIYNQEITSDISGHLRAGLLYRKNTSKAHGGSDMDKSKDKNIYDIELGLNYTINNKSYISGMLVYQEVDKSNFSVGYHRVF